MGGGLFKVKTLPFNHKTALEKCISSQPRKGLQFTPPTHSQNKV